MEWNSELAFLWAQGSGLPWCKTRREFCLAKAKVESSIAEGVRGREQSVFSLHARSACKLRDVGHQLRAPKWVNESGKARPVVADPVQQLRTSRRGRLFFYGAGDCKAVLNADKRLVLTKLFTCLQGHQRLWSRSAEEGG